MKLRTVLISVIVIAVIIIAYAAGSSDNTRNRTANSDASNRSTDALQVEYRITGTADTVSITMENDSGGTQQHDSKRG